MVIELRVRVCDLRVGDIAAYNGIDWRVMRICGGRIEMVTTMNKQDLGGNSQRWVDIRREIPEIEERRKRRPEAGYSNSGHLNTIKKYGS